MMPSLILVLMLIASPAWADTIELTSWEWKVFSLFGFNSLTFAGPELTGFIPDEGATGPFFSEGSSVVPPLVPASVLLPGKRYSVREFFESFVPCDELFCGVPTMTYQGVTYTASARTGTRGFAFFALVTGVLDVPADATDATLMLTGPASLNGTILNQINIAGSGATSVTLFRLPDGSYDPRFAGAVSTPEPSSIILLFLGLALLAVGRHVKSPSRS